MRIEYEYKLMLQPQQLAEQLREVNAARAAAERARDESTDELNVLKASMADQQEKFLADMEAQHAVATEQLEAAYDNRFSVSLPLSGTMALPVISPVRSLGLLLGTEAPVMTPNGIHFSFFFSSSFSHQ